MSSQAEDLRDDEGAVLRARAAALAQSSAEDAGDDIVNLIPFTVAGQPYAVATHGVRQVRRLAHLARIPRSPAALLGITRLHSTVVPVFDLPALLGIAAAAHDEDEWVLVLGEADHPDLGIAAGAVDGIRSLPLGAIVQSVGAAREAAGVWGLTADGVTILDVPALAAAPPVFAASEVRSAVPPVRSQGAATQSSTQKDQG